MRAPRRAVQSDVGQAVIEFALAAPFLLMFILFMVDCGLLAFSYVSAANAVREGARCAVVGGDVAAVQARVASTYSGLAAESNVVVNRPSPDIGTDATVSADYSYDWITPVGLVPGLSGTLDFTKSATMRMETSDVTTKTSCN